MEYRPIYLTDFQEEEEEIEETEVVAGRPPSPTITEEVGKVEHFTLLPGIEIPDEWLWGAGGFLLGFIIGLLIGKLT